MLTSLLFIVLGFNDTSTLVGHFVSSPREREKRDRRDSRRDEREEQGRKRNREERGTGMKGKKQKKSDLSIVSFLIQDWKKPSLIPTTTTVLYP